jgi:hypothetical protein
MTLQGHRLHLNRLIAALAVMSAAGVLASNSAASTTVARCDNEANVGRRNYMTDCRAYEMVTPPYTGGAAVRSLSAISLDGSSMIGTSFGGFAGIENNELKSSLLGAGVYRFSRGADFGWFAEALTPPASIVSHTEYLGASTDLSRTLWGFIESPQPPTNESPPEKELLNVAGRYLLVVQLREPGLPVRFEPVGPEDSPSEIIPEENFTFAGGSSDLGHILYTIKAEDNATWPGDTTREGRPSLYEYSGTGQTEPSLVGVLNEGKLGGNTHKNEGAVLISECGTLLGSAGDKYNAIAKSGNAVVFTALRCAPGPAANQIYARLAEETTVSISQPSHPLLQGAGDGLNECNAVCEGATPKNATFVGASEDGSDVFFTTSQPLLNGDENGIGTGNDLYEAKLVAGRLAELTQVSHDANAGEAAGVLGVARVADSGRRVYFVAQGVLAPNNARGEGPTSGAPNLYTYDTVEKLLQYIGTLSSGDSSDWSAVDSHRPFEVSADGRFAAFLSQAQLTGSENTSTVAQLFEYDAQTEHLARVSIGQQSADGYVCPSTGIRETGYNCNGNTSDPADVPRMATPSFQLNDTQTMEASNLSVTNDGRVFFASLDALVPQALEGSKNIFEYSAGNVYLVDAGVDSTMEAAAFGEPGTGEGRLVSTDKSGADVFFGAVGSLLPQDTDPQLTIYDAREGGGFAKQGSVSSCDGATCRDLSATASTAKPASETVGSEAGASSKSASKFHSRLKSLARRKALARALRKCRTRSKKSRRKCEATVKRRYGAVADVKAATRGIK